LLGVLGAASVLMQVPWLKILFGVLGVAFLAYYGVLKLFETPTMHTESRQSAQVLSLALVTSQALAFSLLNPHVYLDTVVLIGGYSTQFTTTIERVLFGTGASLFSALWFFALALFAAAMGKFLNNARAMKIVSVVSGVILVALAVKLGIDVWEWYLAIA
jgi:L-lysine exporter family protein LysE/ArgO